MSGYKEALLVNHWTMNEKERRCRESRLEQIPLEFSDFREKIERILDWTETGKTCKIQVLNDILRILWIWGELMVTAWVHALQEGTKKKIIDSVRNYDDFTKDNDPYGEHDFWIVTADGEKVYFKTDYYDENKQYGSEDPSDPSITSRVMLIMLAGEY